MVNIALFVYVFGCLISESLDIKFLKVNPRKTTEIRIMLVRIVLKGSMIGWT